MLYNIEGFVRASIYSTDSRNFHFENHEARNPMEAAAFAIANAKDHMNRPVTVGNTIIREISPVNPIVFDDLAQWIYETLSDRWFHHNEKLVPFGFSSYILSTDFGLSQAGGAPLIRYFHPGITCYRERTQMDRFARELTPFIRAACNNRQEAIIAIDTCFNLIFVEQEPECCGDHHSPDYGEPVCTSYSIHVNEVFALASDCEKLRKLISENLSS